MQRIGDFGLSSSPEPRGWERWRGCGRSAAHWWCIHQCCLPSEKGVLIWNSFYFLFSVFKNVFISEFCLKLTRDRGDAFRNPTPTPRSWGVKKLELFNPEPLFIRFFSYFAFIIILFIILFSIFLFIPSLIDFVSFFRSFLWQRRSSGWSIFFWIQKVELLFPLRSTERLFFKFCMRFQFFIIPIMFNSFNSFYLFWFSF